MSALKRGARRAFIAVALTLSQVGSQPGAQEIKTLHLEVFINGESRNLLGEFVMRPDGQLVITRKELQAIGLQPPGQGASADLVNLNTVAGLDVQYDEPRQRVLFTAQPDRLAPTVVDGRGSPVEGSVVRNPRETGLVMNYTLFGSGVARPPRGSRPGFTGGSLSFDAHAMTPWGTFSQSAIAGRTIIRNAEFIRLDTTFDLDDEERAIAYRFGDAITPGPAWSRPIRMGGAQASRNYGLRPDIVTAALPVLNGSAAAPSTVDVIVNGVKTMSQPVPAGPFSLNNMPGLSGSGTAQVVIRDASGREVREDVPFFTSPSLLREGIFEFSGSTGFARYDYASASSPYGRDPLGVAGARYGFTDKLTVETHNEAGAGLANIGLGASYSVRDWGVVSAAGRVSHFGGANGYQGYASFETKFGPFSVSGSSLRSFGDYEDLASVTARRNRPNKIRDIGSFDGYVFNPVAYSTFAMSARPLRASDRIGVGFSGPWTGLSASVAYVHQVYTDRPRSHIVSANLSQSFGPSWSAFVSGLVDFGKQSNAGVFAGLSVSLDDELSAMSSASFSGRRLYAFLEGGKNASSELDSYGARARIGRSDRDLALGAEASYVASAGRGQVSVDQFRGQTGVRGYFDGAIVATTSGVGLSRRVDDSFAFVKVGQPSVEVLHEGRKVARSDIFGNAVVPTLFANQPNRISVDPLTLPVDVSMEKTEHTVTPSRRSAASVALGGRSDSQSATLILKRPDGTMVGAGHRARWKDGEEYYLVGFDGRVFVRGATPGRVLLVDLVGSECAVLLPRLEPPKAGSENGPLACE